MAKAEIREFLTSRRARITPEQVVLPTYGPRRVPGLRREEVAVLAGVSLPYNTRLERGTPPTPGTRSAEALSLLGTWAATTAAEQQARAG